MSSMEDLSHANGGGHLGFGDRDTERVLLPSHMEEEEGGPREEEDHERCSSRTPSRRSAGSRHSKAKQQQLGRGVATPTGSQQSQPLGPARPQLPPQQQSSLLHTAVRVRGVDDDDDEMIHLHSDDEDDEEEDGPRHSSSSTSPTASDPSSSGSTAAPSLVEDGEERTLDTLLDVAAVSSSQQHHLQQQPHAGSLSAYAVQPAPYVTRFITALVIKFEGLEEWTLTNMLSPLSAASMPVHRRQQLMQRKYGRMTDTMISIALHHFGVPFTVFGDSISIVWDAATLPSEAMHALHSSFAGAAAADPPHPQPQQHNGRRHRRPREASEEEKLKRSFQHRPPMEEGNATTASPRPAPPGAAVGGGGSSFAARRASLLHALESALLMVHHPVLGDFGGGALRTVAAVSQSYCRVALMGSERARRMGYFGAAVGQADRLCEHCNRLNVRVLVPWITVQGYGLQSTLAVRIVAEADAMPAERCGRLPNGGLGDTFTVATRGGAGSGLVHSDHLLLAEYLGGRSMPQWKYELRGQLEHIETFNTIARLVAQGRVAEAIAVPLPNGFPWVLQSDLARALENKALPQVAIHHR